MKIKPFHVYVKILLYHTNVRIYLAMDSCTVNNLMKL